MPAITTASLWQIIAWATPNTVEWETQCRKTTTTISLVAITWVWACNALVVPVQVAPGQLSSLPAIKCKDSNNNNSNSIHNNKALTLLVLMAPVMLLVVASPEIHPALILRVAMPTRMDSTMLNSHRVLDQSFTTVETTWVIRIE